MQQLASEPVLNDLPGRATATAPTQRKPARYRKAGFDGGGDDGPSVVVTFSSSQPPSTVFQFYAAKAAGTGWSPISQNVGGYPNSWHKPYPGGGLAGLLISDLDIRTTAPGAPHRYSLAAGLPAQRHN